MKKLLSKKQITFIKSLVGKEESHIQLFDDEKFLNYVALKKQGLLVNKNDIRAIALRGSGTDYGFYANADEGLYNLGLTSADLYISLEIYKKNVHHLVNLEYVFLYVAVMSPGSSMIMTKERYRAVAYKYFFNIDYQNPAMIDRNHEKNILKKCNKINILAPSDSYHGYNAQSYFGVHITAQDRVKTHLRENQRTPDQINNLKELASLCKTNNHKLVIVIPPYRSDYKSLLPESGELFKKFYDIEGDVWKIVDFYNSATFNDSDMGDTDHPNENGAIKMTSELLKEVGYRSGECR